MKYWFSFFICIVLFFACEIEQTDNDVYGCCHSDAWNYDSDVTVHVDSVCIYDFVFTNPTTENIWFDISKLLCNSRTIVIPLTRLL